MEERIIKLETALLLSKKGFCHGSPFFYNCSDRVMHSDNPKTVYINGLEVDYIEAPTQSLVQKWLRENKERMVIVGMDYKNIDHTLVYTANMVVNDDPTNPEAIEGTKAFETYEDALEEGLIMALNTLPDADNK
jgi:hypothetical protein|nr:MAG TPA: hypothetical protein [Bacteriophage sp.]